MKFSELSPEERFKIVSEFPGWGNQDGPLWFVGLEEAGEWPQLPWDEKYEKLFERYTKKVGAVLPGEIAQDAKRLGRSYTKIYNVMSKLTLALIDDERAAEERWKKYRDTELLVENGVTFQTNLYPLGKKRFKGELLDRHKSIFGFGPDDFDRYRERVKNDRLPCLRKAWEHHQPRLTVCFGTQAWHEFEELFELRSAVLCPGADSLRFSKLFRVSNRGVVLTPFFDPRFMSKKRIRDLADLLRGLFPLSLENPR